MRLSHTAIKEFLLLKEEPLRSVCYPKETVAKIIRYGLPVGSRMETHCRLDRCMDRLRQLLKDAENRRESLASGTVVLAEALDRGSGRFGRYWHAPDGGLWLALAWADTLLPETSRFLPFAVGIACCEAIQSYGIAARLKWVNDVRFANRKLAGVLCETITSPVFGDRYFLIGIGVNVNNIDFPTDLRKIAVSLRSLLDTPLDLEEFSLTLLAKLAWNVGLLHYQEELMLASDLDGEENRCGPVLEAWRLLSDSHGRRVVYGYDVQKQPLYRATVSGIDEMGGLSMTLDDGSTITEYGGEIDYLD